MSADDDSKSPPKSMRHKRILDLAAERPDASLDELAAEVPSATADLVERILEKYGDPADDGTTVDQPTPSAASDEDTPSTDSESGTAADTDDADATESVQAPNESSGAAGSAPDATEPDDTDADTADGPAETDTGDVDATAEWPSAADLSEKQREVLEAVARDPTATQRAIGERIGVSGATVSNRANGIEGFDWSEREAFVDAVLPGPAPAAVTADGGQTVGSDSDGAPQADTDPSEADPDSAADLGAAVDRLEERVAALEANGNAGPASDGDSPFADPELVHKVVHACLESEAISEAEELRILDELLS
ncbi:winged helix-turn-helix domain-containing protein [Halostella litorea]|uniref:winged helix-turn-helix domain-containing protein n=1 Tax=Halostella litorea TaxID=2528831 RepID=UPI001F2B15BB|nr:winged helix-turn-helix domain-containing protein [Halostella litorea]